VLVIQPLHRADNNNVQTGDDIHARTASGTAIVEYCFLN
jgi:hypothetical protein